MGGFIAADVVQKPIVVQASTTQIDGHTYSVEVVEALNEINRIRKATGLQPYKIDPRLSNAAELHAKYLVTHLQTASHYQTEGKSGFTGRRFMDRAKAAGYTINSGSEAVAYYGMFMNPKKAITDFVEAIFHRDTILGSSYDTVGIGVHGLAMVILVDNSDNNDGEAYMYPYDGQKDAPTLFDVNEDPDPLEKYGVKKSGYMPSFTPDVALHWFTENIMTLKDSKGNTVELHNKNNVADTSGNTMFIVPKNELKKGETYTVHVTYHDIYEAEHTHSWSFTTEKAAVPTPPTPVVPSTPAPPSAAELDRYAKKFADFNRNAWWAGDMIWAVERGYISGYGKALNPKTKKYEEYLRPGNQLTEAHFLMILFRYMIPYEYESMKATSKWAYNVPYKLAERHNLPTLGSESSAAKKKQATQGITRGRLAQILVSFHERERVSEAAAIKFLIENKITSAKTVQEYNANQILTRAQVSAFLQRHAEFVDSLRAS